MGKPIEKEIEVLKGQLNGLIGAGCNFTEVYDLSVKLDGLILQYLHQNQIVKSGTKLT